MAEPKTRCAIYTRKSSEEGLDQAFNSLDAQYEACVAYVASQRHEGWRLLKQRYDDGGISGGTLDRPGLLALLAEIDEGRVDRIVVYKIDRLTRSLADFAKIVDRLDAAGASFVSVTQSFNTATSMGRLTLNMLLSFAQFEREVTAERIRDKIAASKAKGMWMGGTVPLGYEPHPDKSVRGLVINEPEAADVRTIFGLAAELGTLRRVAEEVERLGIRSKRRTYASGKRLGGRVMSKGQIHHLLTNPLYIGRIRHKDQVYPGRHEPIIDEALWDRVQGTLSAKSVKARGASAGGDHAAPLLGKLFDDTGDRLTPSHTKKDRRNFRYYISNRLLHGKDPTGWRLPAKAIETAITEATRRQFQDPAVRARLFDALPAAEIPALANRLVEHLGSFCKVASLLSQLVARIDLAQDEVVIQLDTGFLAEHLGIEASAQFADNLVIRAPLRLRRRGVEQKILIGEAMPDPNAALLKCLAQAHQWVALLKQGKTLPDVATEAGVEQDYIRKRIRLSTLSPRIQRAIATGDHPDHWSILTLIRTNLPMAWHAQENLLFRDQKPASL